MKILIAIPCSDTICPETFRSIYGLDRCGHWCLFDFIRGYDCASARNRIAEEAMAINADYVLMVDADNVIPSNALKLMLENPVDVCLSFYAHRTTDGSYKGNTNICRLYKLDGSEYFSFPLESEYTAQEIDKMAADGATKIKVHGGGLGCALIKTEVFKKLGYPYFKWINYEDEKHSVLGEDLFFAVKCKEKGIPVHADVRVKSGHVFRYVQNVL